MDIKTRIETAQQKLKKAEQAKTVAETQLKSAEESLAEVVKEMEAAGVTPETIDDEIKKLEESIESGLTKIEEMIPDV